VAGLLAAPRAYARWRASTDAQQRRLSTSEAVEQLDTMSHVLAAISAGPGGASVPGVPFSLREVAVTLDALRALLDGWDAESPPAPQVVAKARELLATLGMPEPPGGWDDYLPED
jgi:hypothetical protein